MDKLVTLLEHAPTVTYEAKDLLRASRLSLLAQDDVAMDLDKVKRGAKVSPILLVRGRFMKDRDLVIADGYHRVCARSGRARTQRFPVASLTPRINTPESAPSPLGSHGVRAARQ